MDDTKRIDDILRKLPFFETPIFLFVVLVLSIFYAETLLMAVLYFLPAMHPAAEAVLDAVLLVALLLPALYLFLFRPLVRQSSRGETAEKALHESNEMCSTAARDLKAIVVKATRDLYPVHIYGAVEEITGYSGEEMVSEELWQTVVHPDDLQMTRQMRERAASNACRTEEAEYRLVRKDGGTRWVHETIHNICDSSGRPKYLQMVLKDISRIKESDGAPKASHN